MKSNRIFLPLWLMACMFVMTLPLHAQKGNNPQKPQRRCGSEFGTNDILQMGPDVRNRYLQLQRFTRQYIQNLRNKQGDGFDGARGSSIIIPVVVHIVWRTAAENIPDARVTQQIDRLNKDYQRLNADAGSVPAEFAGVASNLQIQFKLAVRDANCMATTGITRTNTSVVEFSVPSDATATDINFNPVKSTAAGGKDAWPADRYLNIWVCNLEGGILGYSSFPGFPANVDGVVIGHQFFGNTSGDFNLGRTATHEIGHYLNLFHTFQSGCSGTTAATCETDGDEVCDTPPVNGPNFGCPAGTLNSCTETPDQNDQWMNYMDYTNDACMFMFSSGQKERVDACIYGARTGLLGSDALIPVASGATADLWSQDKPDDIGDEPNTISDAMYQSEDIWVRNAAGTAIQEHQNPASNAVNHVYVRIRNRICGSSGTATVRLFWAKASSALSWPAPWDGTVSGPPVMGGQIGTATVTVTGTASQIVDFTWNTPNVADYAAFGADAGHFCLLARIETAGAPDFGLTFPSGTGDLWGYVKNNNNVVWKNVQVVGSDGERRAALVVGNMNPTAMRQTQFIFRAPRNAHDIAFTDIGKVKVTLGPQLYDLWKAGGKQGNGFVDLPGQNAVEISTDGASIGGFTFNPKQIAAMKLDFSFTQHLPWATHKLFNVNVEQRALKPNGEEYIVGGQNYAVRNPQTGTDGLLPGNNGTGTTNPIKGRWLLSAHAGVVFPLGSLSSTYKTGWLGEFDIEYRLSNSLSLELLAGRYNFTSKLPSVSNTHITGLTLYARRLLSPTAPTSLYIAAGPGLYLPRSGSNVFGVSGAAGIQRNLSSRVVGELGAAYFVLTGSAANSQFATAKIGIKVRL